MIFFLLIAHMQFSHVLLFLVKAKPLLICFLLCYLLGTLMEFGVFPICIAGDIVGFFVEPKLLQKDRNTIDNILIKGANKCVYLNNRTLISNLTITGRLIWSSKYKCWWMTWCVFILFYSVYSTCDISAGHFVCYEWDIWRTCRIRNWCMLSYYYSGTQNYNNS